MLGLDTGWNCHISLANDTNMPNISKTINYDSFNDQNSTNENFDDRKKNHKSKELKNRKLSKRLWAKRKLSSERKFSHGYSLPNLKLNSQSNPGGHSVKFNLKNSVKERRKSKKLTRLGSVDRSSISSGNSILSVSENYKLNNLDRKAKVKSNLKTASASSIKSSSILKESSKSCKRKSPSGTNFADDDNFSLHSGRSLSETEIYGNAVLT